MGYDSQDDRKDDLINPAKKKLKLLLDKLHKEELSTYDKLIEFLQELCQVSTLKKKPLDLEILAENDVFVLISPSKSWKESEVEKVERYVKSNGGILIVLTIEGRKPEHLNELLKPFGLSVTNTTVDEKQLERDNLERSQLFDGINSLALGTVWTYKNIRIEASNEAEVIVRYKDSILGAKRSLGKGTAYLFSCLPAFGNKQLKQVDNRRFLCNLITLLATPDKTETLAAIATFKISGLHKSDRYSKQAAKYLDELGWKPSNDIERMHYLIAKDEWDKIPDIGESAVESLISFLKKDDIDVQLEAAKALGNIRDERATKHLIHALMYGDVEIRCGAAEALGEIGDNKAIEPLINVLYDTSEEISEVQFRAVRALKKLGKPSGEPLIDVLKHPNLKVRRNVAEALDELGWRPSNDVERIHYLFAKDDLDKILDVTRAFSKIGDESAIKELDTHILDAMHGYGIFSWDYYYVWLLVTAEALTNIGKSDVIQIVNFFKKKQSLLPGLPYMWALCNIGNRDATETVINWIFNVGPMPLITSTRVFSYKGKLLSPTDLIKKCVPPPVIRKLLGDYTNIILDLFAYEFVSYSEETGRFQADLSRCDAAVRRLCDLETPISSNVLHKISKINEIDVGLHMLSSVQSRREYIDFRQFQHYAKEELKRRENPDYDSSIYLKENNWKI